MDPSQSFGGQGPRGVLTPSRTLSGRYELLGRIGTGGMAEVYLARAVGLEEFEKIVVLKRVLPERATERSYVAMFRDEARVAATLDHPNIVHTHDIGITEDECFFTMEYLHGEDLKAIISASRKAGELLPLELALQIVVGCAAGLHHAHEQTDYEGRPLDIVHRDVSPSNIIVTRQNGVKLIDFGIAKAASDKEHTGVGVLKGKVSYMSPEQCRGLALDRRSDIFALGIVLYEMVTMHRPYQGNNVLATVHRILGEEPVPPRELRPECPPALERIILKALDKNVDARYQTVFEMQEELELVARDGQLLALPGGLGRYLEHLFGAKPLPWLQNSGRPPAVPRWAWEDLDSTLTAPRGVGQPQRPELPAKIPFPAPSTPRAPEPVPRSNTATDDTRMRDASRTSQTPGSAPAPTGSYAPVAYPAPTMNPAYAASPPDADPRHMATTSHVAVASTSGWAIKYLMVGGLAGALVAALGVMLWLRSTPSDSAPQAPVPVASAASIVEPVTPTPTPTPEPLEPTIAQTPSGGEQPPGPAVVPETETTPAPETPSSGSSNTAAKVSKLIDRARSKLLSSPRQAHRDAKAAYELKQSQTALQLMGTAGCRLQSEPKAKFAYRRLRGKARSDLESACLARGIDLRQ